MLEHKHFIVRAEVKYTPQLQDIKYIQKWMKSLIECIGMEILIKPKAVYCDKENNRGITCIAALSTSSCALHVWDDVDPCVLQFDLYSCKGFKEAYVLSMINNSFGLINYEYYMIDRDALFEHTYSSGDRVPNE